MNGEGLSYRLIYYYTRAQSTRFEQISLPLLYKSSCSNVNYVHLHD